MPIAKSESSAPLWKAYVMPALAVRTDRRVSKVTLEGNSVLTFGAIPDGRVFSVAVVNGDAAPASVRFPVAFSVNAQALVDTFEVAANGREFLTFHKVGEELWLFGDPDGASLSDPADDPEITSADNAEATVGEAFSFTVTATGDPAPTFAVVSGSFPSWASMNSATGAITGTPTDALLSPFVFTIRADNGGIPDDQTFTLTVAEEGGGGGDEVAAVTGFSGGYTPGTGGEAGFAFTVGGASISITQLGMRRYAHQFGDVTVKLFAADGTTELASAVVDFDSVAIGEEAFAPISPVAVSAGQVRHVRGLISGYNGPQVTNSAGAFTGMASGVTFASLSDDTGSAQGGDVNFKFTV